MIARRPTQRRAAPRRAQRGITLIVALVMLLVFAVLAVTGLGGTITSAQSVANMQWRNEAVNAANDAIEQLLSTPAFATNSAAVTAQVNATPYRMDTNADGVDDLAVTLVEPPVTGASGPGPYCMRAQVISNASLDPTVEADSGCYSSPAPEGYCVEAAGGGCTASSTGDSICANTEWALTVRAQDAVAGTRVDVTQGVGARVFRGDALTYCK